MPAEPRADGKGDTHACRREGIGLERKIEWPEQVVGGAETVKYSGEGCNGTVDGNAGVESRRQYDDDVADTKPTPVFSPDLIIGCEGGAACLSLHRHPFIAAAFFKPLP